MLMKMKSYVKHLKLAIPLAVMFLAFGLAGSAAATDTWDTVATDMVTLIIGIVGDVVDLFLNNPILMLGLGIAIFGMVAGFVRSVIPGA